AAGLELATRLGRNLGRRQRAEVTLIDAGRTHIWKPLLHQVAAGSFDPGLHTVEYLAQAERSHFRFRMGKLETLDRNNRQVWLSPTLNDEGVEIIPRRSFRYDTLVLSVGSVSHDFGIPGVVEHCWFLDDKKEAVTFQKRLMERLIQSATHHGPRTPGQLDIAIVGAGATGVELAAQLHQVTRRLRQFGFEHLDPESHVRLRILDAGPRILPALPERISDEVRSELDDLGIEVMLNQAVTRVTDAGVETASGDFIPAAIIVWAAGIKAPDVTAGLGLEVNGINQIKVGRNLLSMSDDHVFAIGDCAAFPPDAKGWTVPPRAQAAHQQSSFVAKAIGKRLKGKRDIGEWVYRDYGSLVTLGGYSTVGSLMGAITGNLWISGLIARLVYLSLYKMHQVTLHGAFSTLLLTLSSFLRRSVNPEVKLH
ncbi:MAG: NAD(P)/FAD-dependent oxidoreductase, partial [Chromatiaceae bacterium]